MEGTPIFWGMDWNKLSIFPVIGEPLRAENALSLDFIAANGPLQEVGLSDTAAFDAFVFKKLQGIREAVWLWRLSREAGHLPPQRGICQSTGRLPQHPTWE